MSYRTGILGISYGRGKIYFKKRHPSSVSPTATTGKVRPVIVPVPPNTKAEAEPSSVRGDAGCMAHVSYMNLDVRNISSPQVTRKSPGDEDVQLRYEDRTASLLPKQYQDSVTLCAEHAHMCRSPMGLLCDTVKIAPPLDLRARAGILTGLPILGPLLPPASYGGGDFRFKW